MTHETDMRLAVWRDDLSPSERAEVDFVLGMDGGNHATAYLAVSQIRLGMRMVELEKRSIIKDGAKGLGAILALVVTAIASAFASTSGHVPKP